MLVSPRFQSRYHRCNVAALKYFHDTFSDYLSCFVPRLCETMFCTSLARRPLHLQLKSLDIAVNFLLKDFSPSLFNRRTHFCRLVFQSCLNSKNVPCLPVSSTICHDRRTPIIYLLRKMSEHRNNISMKCEIYH